MAGSGGWHRRVLRATGWVLVSAIVGVAAGLASVLLGVACAWAEALHAAFPGTCLALPLLAVVSVLVYGALGLPYDVGTLGAFDSARADRPVSWKIVPAILVGTALTLVGGGSVGKEAGALQMGSGVASAVAGLLGGRGRGPSDAGEAAGRLGGRGGDGGGGDPAPADEAGRGGPFSCLRETGAARIVLLCGMASAFSALLLTPLAAVAFVVEAVRPKKERLADPRMACVAVSAACGLGVASVVGTGGLWRPAGDAPGWFGVCPETLVVVAACAGAGLALVVLLKLVRTGALHVLRNDFVRVALGGAALAALLALVPESSVASGTGAGLIVSALDGSGVGDLDFAWKLLLTVATIGLGLKGGEIMPVMCVGACLGCSLGAALGAPATFCAAVGLVATFSACAGCPLASCLLGLEAFGVAAAPVWILAALVGFGASRVSSLYDSSLWHVAKARPSLRR